MNRFYAHSGSQPDQSDWQLLADHLREVARLAAENARQAMPCSVDLADLAEAAGILHDLGKYRPGFQQYISGMQVPRSDSLHKQAGAAKAANIGLSSVAFAIFGHHGGMPNLTDLQTGIKPTNQPAADWQTIWPQGIADCPQLALLETVKQSARDPWHAELVTRVLFSCLVDADWTDTAKHDRYVKGLPAEPQPSPLNPQQRLEAVLGFVARRAKEVGATDVGKVRSEILAACLSMADASPGIFSLTVPTGGGKTLASLAFALKHAATHDLRRVIYVAPYMSILEQNAFVFRAALGVDDGSPVVFEHYSLAEPPEGNSANETDRTAAARRTVNCRARTPSVRCRSRRSSARRRRLRLPRRIEAERQSLEDSAFPG